MKRKNPIAMPIAKKPNKTTKNSPSRFTPQPKLTAEEQFWNEVDQSAQEKIYQLLTNTLPLPNLKLITEPYRYEDKQQTLTGLFLHKDVDYRTLLGDIQNQYAEEELPDKEYLAEEITLWYFRLVMKALLADLSDYAGYDTSYFENLTE
jgi:hypothetical protein